MSTYTREMLEEFDQITLQASSRDQVTRISGRLALNHFIKKHGKEVCDAMFAELNQKPKRRRKREAAQ